MAGEGGVGGVPGGVALPGLVGSEPPLKHGRTDTRSVSEVPDAEPHLDQLNPSATPPTSLSSRESQEVPGHQTEGLKTKEEDKRNPDELKADQAKAFEKVGELTEKYEQHSVLGRALEALKKTSAEHEEMKGAAKSKKALNALKKMLSEKTDLKVTITLAGSDKPITLVPLNEKELGNENLEALMKLAMSILEEHQTTAFAGFDAAATARELQGLHDSIKTIATKLGDDKKEEGENECDKMWEKIRHKPARVVARTNEADVHVERIQSERPEKKLPEKPQPGQKPDQEEESEPGVGAP
ncbi:MAG: hypothetical protein ACR2PT_17285 [Endozoicomonas sp.]